MSGSCPCVPTRVDDWQIPDPHGKSLEDMRAIRDIVEDRVQGFIDERLDAVRSDSTLTVSASPSFCDCSATSSQRPTQPRRSEAAPTESCCSTPTPPVRSFVMTIAHKNTRACLREGRCGTPAAA